MRQRILAAFEYAEAEEDIEKCKAWLRFVVGGGPTGVELAGTLAEIARHTLRNEFRRCDPTQAHVMLIETGPRVLSIFPEALSTKAQQQLERLVVDVRTGTAVINVDERAILLGAEPIAAKTVLWAAGVAASSLGAKLYISLKISRFQKETAQ